MGIALSLMLVVVRAILLGYEWWFFDKVFLELPKVLFAATYDVVYVAGLTFSFFVTLRLIGSRRRRLHQLTVAAYHLLALMSLLACMANIKVIEMLGKPFNYQWLYYSDFLASADARQAIAEALTWRVAADATVACLAVLMLGRLVAGLIWLFAKLVRPGALALAGGALLGGYFWIGHWYLVSERWPAAKTTNPLVAFAGSYFESMSRPALYSIETPYGPDDFRPNPQPSTRATIPKIDNVVVFVLESVGAGYLDMYGGRYGVTPNLNRAKPRSATFHGIYAHTPGTNPSLVALNCSVYPWVSYKTVTAEHPEASLDSIAEAFQRRGARTGFFSSSGLDYQRTGDFLAHRGYELLQDHRNRPSATKQFTSKWSFLYGNSDSDTVDSLLQWMDQNNREGKPSFAMLWTLQAHYPYYVAGEIRDFGTKNKNHDRYLSAVREIDAALGKLLDWLEEHRLADSTLVVVVGDHGEAFGQHNNYGHGSALYEENLRVPLVFINAKLFAGEEHHIPGGLVDVAPTITDVLGLPAMPNWQGRSLLHEDRPQRLYFCAPWSDFLFGYREGNLKLMLNALKGDVQVFDLAADPGERKDVSKQHPDFVKTAQQRLASWVQYQADFYSRAFSPTDRSRIASVGSDQPR